MENHQLWAFHSIEKSTVTSSDAKLPEFLTDYLFWGCALIHAEMEKKGSVIHVDLCESLFGHLLFGHLVLTCKSVRWREWNKDRIVCVSVQTQDLSWDGRELADEFLRYTPFAPFCSVLLHCVIPGDVNWHVSPGWQKLGMQLDSRR